jgi:hypothetical protein
MYTCLVILSTPSLTSFMVAHFENKEKAQEYKPEGNCAAEVVAIYDGEISDEEAIEKYLD